MKNIRAEELMAAYLSGNISSAERKELMGWVADSSQGQEFFDKAVSLWSVTEEMAYPDFSAKKAQAWDQVVTRLDGLEHPAQQSGGNARVIGFNIRSWAAAAAIAILGVAAWWVLQSPAENAAVIASTLADERKEMQLPDGTQVWLNENTYLTYEEVEGERRLRLEGEAFFDVATDSLHPFKIYAGDAVTTVLGTAFNIRAYPEEEQVEVSVKEGRVRLERRQEEEAITPVPEVEPVVLAPGEQGVYKKVNAKIEAKEKRGKNSAAWRDRKMDFTQVELAEVVQTIERYYDVEIELANPGLGKCELNGKFDNPTLADLLLAVEYSLELEIEEKDGIYRLSGEACE